MLMIVNFVAVVELTIGIGTMYYHRISIYFMPWLSFNKEWSSLHSMP